MLLGEIPLGAVLFMSINPAINTDDCFYTFLTKIHANNATYNKCQQVILLTDCILDIDHNRHSIISPTQNIVVTNRTRKGTLREKVVQ